MATFGWLGLLGVSLSMAAAMVLDRVPPDTRIIVLTIGLATWAVCGTMERVR